MKHQETSTKPQSELDDAPITPSKKKRRTPPWNTWKNRPICSLGDAVLLTLNVDPIRIDKLKTENSAKYSTYISRLKTASLQAYGNGNGDGKIKVIENHPNSGAEPASRIIELASFVAYAMDLEVWKRTLPEKLLMITGHSIVGMDNPIITNPSSTNEVDDDTDSDTDTDTELQNLFDNVTVTELEATFPADGKWKKWADHAKQNGLNKARLERAKFNLYLAGIWFLKQGMKGWNLAHINRTLAKNLPARSRGKESYLGVEPKY